MSFEKNLFARNLGCLMIAERHYVFPLKNDLITYLSILTLSIQLFQMSVSKKQDANNRPAESKEAELILPPNPFAFYVGTTSHSPHDNQSEAKTKQREKRSSSDREKEERSRSRDRKPKGRGYEYENPKHYGDSRSFERRDHRDQGNNFQGLKKDFARDESCFKTKLCPLFDKGECQKGSSCTFAHGDKELKGLPNFRKTRLCMAFKKGECMKSISECKYAHGQSDLRKIAYDYYPEKNQDFNRYERSDRRDRERGERGGDRGGYRDRYRDHEGQREHYKPRHYQQKDYGNRGSYPPMGQAPPNYPPQEFGPYISSFNNAYMIPPSAGNFNQSGQLYPPPSSYPNMPNPSSFASGPPNMKGQGPYPVYNMGSYEYGYGYMPNYPPFNPSSV